MSPSLFDGLPARAPRRPKRGTAGEVVAALAFIIVLLTCLAIVVFIGTCAVWATAWLVTHYPHN